MLKTEAEWCDALKERCWHRLTDWERNFLEGVLDRGRWPLSPKQREVLNKMRDKYGRAYA